MPLAPPAASTRPDLPFRHVGGDVAADLVNTVNWLDSGPAEERMPGYEPFVDWAAQAGLVSTAEARRLRTHAHHDPVGAGAALAEVHYARWVLKRLLTAVARGERGGTALQEFNTLFAEVMRRVELRDGSHCGAPIVRRAYRGFSDLLSSPLWLVLESAADLLVSADVGKLRVCAGDDCGWVFVDRSRNGLRRWCEMETCGTIEKSARRRSRSRKRERPRTRPTPSPRGRG